MTDPTPPAESSRAPIFNLPPVIVALIAVLVGIQAARDFLVTAATEADIVFSFAFIPARITESAVVTDVLPGGAGAEIWSFVTYAFLHADWSHLAINALWLAAFGSPLAWRFGTARFLLFSAAGAIGGAAMHLAIHPESLTPLVGASAAISAHMAAASRFLFGTRGIGSAGYHRPAPPLVDVFRDSRVVIFLGIWFGMNLVFGLLGPETGLASGAIAWEAHIGGFLVGLFLFPLFDPVTRHGRAAD
ncbi:MAG TPA: rhomboid family intramembrane serine protease [Bauldia sp.]|nr:rhomboid family intramembrane serine protease [Bauldia sp.]